MNLIDIAEAAGVSTSTVSRVIHGNKNISPETAALVYQVMQDFGYLPVTSKEKKTPREWSLVFKYHVTALSFGWKTRSNFSCGIDFLNQLSASLAVQGIQLTYLHWPWSSQLPSKLFEHAHGFIIIEGSPSVKVCRQISSKPVVSLFGPSGVPGDQILTGYYQVGKLAANYFLQKNIHHMILLRPCHQPAFFVEQEEGFKSFCTRDENIFFEELATEPQAVSIKQESLEKQVQKLIDRFLSIQTSPIGIFSPSCHVTVLAYHFLHKAGIAIGKDIHFVCSNSQTSLLLGLHPRPAVIDTGLLEMTQNTANILCLRIRNPKAHGPFQISVVPSFMKPESLSI